MVRYLISRLIKKAQFPAILKSKIPRTSKVEAGSRIIESTFGKYSFCGYDCRIIKADIGSFTSIADNVIIGGARHPYEWVSTSPVFYAGRDSIKKKFSEFERAEDPRTVVGNDVWIGTNAMIKSGVQIGNGAVIGMGSVVTKDVRPFSIVAGNPAKHIKFRFEEQTLAIFDNMEWWNFSETKLSKLAAAVTDPDKFICLLKKDDK
jgi:acetyltransferase-like isoleucine patch superfamily enzyme